MAEFKPSASSASGPWDLSMERPPEGTYVAKIIDCRDEFGVTRPKFENPMETETLDRTIFLLGFRDAGNHPHRITSRWMRISGNEKSALYSFLRNVTGKPFPYGQDYSKPVAEGGVIGRSVLISIQHEQKKNGSGVYPVILTISQVPAGFVQQTQQPQPAAPTPPPAPAPAAPPPAAPAAFAPDAMDDDSGPIPF